MGVEDGAVLPAQFAIDSIAVFADFYGRRGESLVEALQFRVNDIARYEPPRNAKSLVVHDQRFADGYAGRNGDPL
jgi:hypothetical protein